MVGFPEVPVMLTPFGCNGNLAAEFNQNGDDGKITYSKGIPLPYSVPTAAGGVKFTRQEMNRLGYDATIGTFLGQFGWRATFDPRIGGSGNTGYPRGARLMWYKLAAAVSTDILPSGSYFPGHVESFSDTKSYSKGNVVEHGGAIYAYNKAGPASGAWNSADWTQVVIADAIEVVSLIDNNTHDFRADGPDGEVYWKYVDEQRPTFFPRYSDLQNPESLLFSKTASSQFGSELFVVQESGWIVVSATREIDRSTFTTVGDMLSSYADGVTVTVANAQSTNPILSYSYQFGASDSIYRVVPVPANSRVSVSLSDARNDSVTVKLYKIGAAE